MLASVIVPAQNIALTQTVKGIVLDEQSGSVLSNATVVIEGRGTVTDSLGNFRLKNIPAGRQTIRVSLTGYEETVISNIEVTSSKEVILEIRLKERIKKLEEVVIIPPIRIHDLRVPLAQKGKSPAHCADVNRLPESVQNKNLAVEHKTRWAARARKNVRGS